MSTALPTVPVLHAEWIKIRSLRGTFAALICIFAVTLGIQVLVAAMIGQAEAGSMGDDPLLAAFYSLNFGQIAAFAFGATALSCEFHDGALRTSLTAVPNRARLYLSKMVVVGAVALVVGQVAALATFLGGQAFMGSYALDLGSPGTYRAVFGCGAYLALMALLAAGLTAVLRSATAVLSLLIPFTLIVSFVLGAASEGVARFLPDRAGQMMMRLDTSTGLAPWTGLGVLALWALVAVTGGWLSLRRRDA
ncbi:ABC transporter permease subunit [Streptomyces sp. ISL-66]|uniref:ABC transporter permease n=1 Tax=Streptomyces sp. ISL-66 TaxID=2819186 RepID=UPI001BE92B4D|nr:ABC transporter permease [Streptomyces sp. ISL-66]MBT2469621.1 ABC transporter permease subunit [Streptomyces sp. ISL-66]